MSPRPADRATLAQLRAAAHELGDLLPELVFVGGAVTSLLLTDPAASAERPTDDTDTITNPHTVRGYHAIEARLRGRGFTQDPTGESPVCRWFKGVVVIDVMPDDPAILGFSNRWYREAYDSATEHDLGDVTFRVVDPVYFLATKLQAFAGRGEGDYQASHDLEDIVRVVDGRMELPDEVAQARAAVRT